MLEILSSRSGAVTARLDGRYLHSPTDPGLEAGRLVEPLVRRDPPCIVLLGFGLGYAAEALLEGTQATHLVVFEPNETLAAQLRTARDVTATVESQRLTWCGTVESLDQALSTFGSAGFEVLTLRPRRLAEPDAFTAADYALAAYRSRLDINANTVAKFGRLWVRNLSRNLTAFAEGAPVTRLAGMFHGIPGLLLAAGPSLDQILPHLPELAERTVVVAVDTAVSVCLANGVTPDIAVVVDPQYWNARHLDAVEPSATLLVAESSTHPSVFRRFRSPSMFCSSLFPLGREMETAFGQMGTLGTGGSVSTTGWDLLRYAGCSPIYIAGLDLGFPGSRTHFRGSFFETLAVAIGTRFRTAERTLHRYIWSADPTQVDANGGGTVITDRRMDLYRRWFSRKTTESGSPPTFTLTTGGVRIEGITLAERAAVLAHPPVRAGVERELRKIVPAEPAETATRRSAVAARVTGLIKELEPLEELADRAVRIVDEMRATLSEGRTVDFSPLQSIDDAIRDLGARAVASFLMQQAISRITAGFGSASLAEQVEASAELYGELHSSVRFHLETLRACQLDG